METQKRKNQSGPQQAYQFSRKGTCLNTSFFAKVREIKKEKSTMADLSQRQYLLQCGQRAQTGDSLIP